MAEITSFGMVKHLRGEMSSHIVLSRGGTTALSRRGAAFWFLPMSSSISEVPMDDRELPFLFRGRSQDFQDVTTQGVIAWRVVDPERLADRIDCTLDLNTGAWTKQPLEQVAQLLTETAQQVAWGYLAHRPLAESLRDGVAELRARIVDALAADPALADIGLKVIAVRIKSIAPTSEVAKALQMPTREAIQQEADRATYERRALAVERERAIAENELKTKIELAKREESLIAQRGANKRRQITEDAEARRLGAEAAAERTRLEAAAEADRIRTVEEAKSAAEEARVAIYRDLPVPVMIGLTAQELAGNLPPVEHLVLSPDLFGPALTRLAERVGAGS